MRDTTRSLRLYLFRCRDQCHSGPSSGHHRNPLVIPMGKSALKIRLESERPGANVPRAIRFPCLHQEIDATPICVVVDQIGLCYRYGRERLPGGIGIRVMSGVCAQPPFARCCARRLEATAAT